MCRVDKGQTRTWLSSGTVPREVRKNDLGLKVESGQELCHTVPQCWLSSLDRHLFDKS